MVLRAYMSPTRNGYSRLDYPFLSFQRAIQRTVDEAFSITGETPSLSVRLDVTENDKAYTVVADLPGLKESEVDVSFDDGILAIRGEKKSSHDEKTEKIHISERRYGSFARRISLPANVKADAIEAKFDKGVLTIILPKEAEPEKTSKKIAIKTA